MNVIPAIDLRGGRCVRLFQGDFGRETEYGDDPAGMAATFAEMGASHLHVVDLDGARSGEQQNQGIVRRIVAESPLSVQLGGGIRDRRSVMRWIEAGVGRCVIGSAAVTDGPSVARWLQDFGPERIVLALDVRLDDGSPMVATHGWKTTSDECLWDCVERYLDSGLKHLLCTDVSRDGAMAGPNIELYREFVRRFGTIELQASGGVRGIDDLHALRAAGTPAAITGRALLEGKLTPTEIRSFLHDA